MTASASAEKRSITKDSIREIARFGGPSVSLFLSKYAPGAGAGSEQVWLKTAIQEIRHDLRRHHFPEEEIDQLMRPLDDLAASDTMKQGHARGEAWFLSPEATTRLETGGAAGRGFAVGQQPYVLPLLGALALPNDYYILGLARQNVTLFRCRNGEIAVVPLPDSIPADLERMLEFDEPDHDRDNQSAAGPSTGRMKAVRFGTGDEAESSMRYLHQFFKLLDRRVSNILENKAALVVLAGVHYEVTEFLRLAEWLNVVRDGSIEGAFKDMTPAQLLAKSADVLQCRYRASVNELAERLRESENKVENTTAILQSTLEGRVWRVFLAEESPMSWLQNWRENLELNRVVVEATRRGADVFLAEAGQMPDGSRVAAMLRY